MSDFTLDDFKEQLQRVLHPGLYERMAGLAMPGEMQQVLADPSIRREAQRGVGIIEAMTPVERCTPSVIDVSRRNRIARGAGTSPQEVIAILKQHEAIGQAIRAVTERTNRRFRD